MAIVTCGSRGCFGCILSDGLIAFSLLPIPFTLVYFVRKRRDLEFNRVSVCFAVFIVACG